MDREQALVQIGLWWHMQDAEAEIAGRPYQDETVVLQFMGLQKVTAGMLRAAFPRRPGEKENAIVSTAETEQTARKHNHYFKSVQGLDYIDVYRTLRLFEVTDQAIGHAIKKLLVAGGRGGGKDISRDIQEAIDTLLRWQEMQKEQL